MRFFMKQKVFSWREEFAIKDETGIDRYFAQGEFFSWGHKLHLYAPGGVEVAYIEQRLWTWMPKYRVFIAGNQVAEIVQKFNWFRPKYTVHGPNWQVQGEFWEHEYEIFSPLGSVARISKEWFTWGDSYCVEVLSPADELGALCVALALDCCMCDAQTASNVNH